MTILDRGFVVSALGIGWPEHLVTLVKCLDRLGYHRYWATEHHARRQSSSPTIAMAAAAASARRIAVGTAGVMLRYVNPLRLAKDAHLLELLFPGRVDIGTIGGTAAKVESCLHRALSFGDESTDWNRNAFIDLVRYVRDPDLPFDDGTSPNICRALGAAPRLWLCTNSTASAVFAATQSVGLVFHLPQARAAGLRLAADVIDSYRAAFVPSTDMEAPRIAVVCAGICCDTDTDAREAWAGYVKWSVQEANLPAKHAAQFETPLSTFFLGKPDICREQIESVAESLRANEVIVCSTAESFDIALRSYELLAEAFGLSGADSTLPINARHDNTVRFDEARLERT